MPRLPANAAPILRFAVRLDVRLFSAALLAMASPAMAQTGPSELPARTAPAMPAQSRIPVDSDTPWPRLKLERLLSEKRLLGTDAAPTFARAQRIEGTIDEKIVLEGNAEVRRGGTVLRGDRITYTQATDQVDVEGNARVFKQGGSFSGPELSFRIDAQTGAMPDAQFAYPARSGRGDATLIEFLGDQRARMENARFTTCAPGDDAWWVQAESLEVDGLDQSASASGARLYFQGVPILASPILGFPIGDQRRSGFLTPSFGLSTSVGTDIRTPFYWNIAPNYDYTITPRAMTKRGTMLGNEFRFLQPTFSGTLLYDVIPYDRQTEETRDYTGVRLNYSAPSGVAAGVNYNRVSDDNYFVDFSSTILGSSQKVLPQDGFVSYTQTYWNTAVRVTKNQILQDPLAPVTPPYERVPQVTVNGFVADWNGFEAAAILDGTRFTNPDSGLQPGSRYIFNPRVAYPILNPGWFITPRAQLSATYYSLDPDFNPQDQSQTRVMPILSLDTGLIFERDTEWFGRSSQQTLEPRLYYAYIPFRNQNQLPNFDSALADLNYAQFFTENIYSGYDRIVNANQLTLGDRHARARPGNRRRAPARGRRPALLLFGPEGHPARRVAACQQRDRSAGRPHGAAGQLLGGGLRRAVFRGGECGLTRHRRHALAAPAGIGPERVLPLPGKQHPGCRHQPDRHRAAVAAVGPLVRRRPLQLLLRKPQTGGSHCGFRVQGGLLAGALRVPALPDDHGLDHDQLLRPAGTVRPYQCRNQCAVATAA